MNTDTDTAHCGQCDRPCLSGSCINGVCETQSCNDARPCGDNATCTAEGTCACDGGYHFCGGQCVSSTSTATCGTSCTACLSDNSGTATCDGITCGLDCNTGFALCGGSTCLDLQSDSDNCGRCGTQCGNGQTCIAGLCDPPASCSTGSPCAPGFYCDVSMCRSGCDRNEQCPGSSCDIPLHTCNPVCSPACALNATCVAQGSSTSCVCSLGYVGSATSCVNWTSNRAVISSEGLQAGGAYGSSVALASIARIGLVGAPMGGASGSGIVTLHRWSMTTGSLMDADVIPDDRVNGLFGTSVAISSDGNVIAVGAPNPTDRGRVRVRRGTTWAALDGGDRGRFGEAIALSSDGDWLLIGAPEAGSGQAVVRHWNGNFWDSVGVYLLPPPAGQTDGDRFGSSVAIGVRPDGRKVIAIGAPGRNSEAGAVYIFSVSGNTLGGPHLTLTSPSQPLGHFGAAVALSADGQHLAVGAPGSGQVFTYRSNDGYFWQPSADTLTNTGGDGFGQSVAMSADGYVLGVGAPLIGSGSGVAFFYSRSGNSWVRRVTLPTGQPASRAGESIAINAGGTAAMVGEPGFPTAGRFTFYCAASGC